MSDSILSGLDDARLTDAARRIIRTYRLQQTDLSEGSPSSVVPRARGAPDDPENLRLSLDNLSLAVEQMQRLFASRDAVFLASLERIERNLAKTDGRLDALVDEITRVAAQPVLDVDTMADSQRVVTAAIMREYGSMMALGRSLLDEIRQLHREAFPAAIGAATGGEKSD